MRIEELDDGKFIKIPDKVEEKVIKTINRYVESDPDLIKGSREDIIMEVQKRIRPMIANMVKAVAWLEGETIFNQQLRTVLDEEMARLSAEMIQTLEDMNRNILSEKHVSYEINNDFTIRLSVPSNMNIKKDVDIFKVFVNGQLQERGVNYYISVDSNDLLTFIDFDPGDLIRGDLVVLNALVYTSQGPSTNIGPGR